MHLTERFLRHGHTGFMLLVLGTLAVPAARAAAPATRPAAPAQACEPEWPEAAPIDGRRRATKLMLQVNAKGKVTSATIVESSNTAELDAATVEAAKRCQFVPALKRGKPAAASVPFTYAWNEYIVVQEVRAPVAVETVPARTDFASCPRPAWPKSSLRNEETGTVTMGFLIGTDGAVKETKLRRSSGFPDLDNSALEALAKCTFQPATRAGQAIESWTAIQYVWTLE